MKHFRLSLLLSAILVVTLLSACGYNPEDPVYNTAKNSKDFPTMAVSLLDDMEEGQIAGLDSVSNSFAELYIAHPELLDNNDWQEIISRLGSRFLFLAERLRDSQDFGINDYTQIADYYTLAAFAHPGDTGLYRLAEAFACWRTAVEAHPRLDNPVGRSTMTLSDKISVVRLLAYADDACREYLHDYLLTPLFGTSPDVVGADLVDQLLLQSAGLPVEVTYDALATFAGPRIDLVSIEVVPLDSGKQDLQVFFVPHDSVVADYNIAFWIHTGKSGDEIGESRIPFDFEPSVASSHWKPGQAAAAHQIVEYQGTISDVSIGLYKSFGARLEFVPLAGTDSNLLRLSLD